jgi:hypothetical protein
MLNTNQTVSPKTYRIVNGRGKVINDMQNLSLYDAEVALCRAIVMGHNAYLEDQPTALQRWQDMQLSEDEVRDLVGIGFCQPKFYRQSVWKKAKALMNEIIIPNGWAFPYDYGFGKGKYSTDLDIETVKLNVLQTLCVTNKEIAA